MHACWMPADFQWRRTRTLIHAYGPSAMHSNTLFELDALHAASDQYDLMRGEYRGMGFSSKEVIQQATLPDSGCDAIFASHRLFDSFFEERFCDWTFIGPHVDAYAVSQPVAVKYQVSCRTACLPEREPGLQPPRLPPAS